MAEGTRWRLVCQDCNNEWERTGELEAFFYDAYCEWCSSQNVRAVQANPPSAGENEEA